MEYKDDDGKILRGYSQTDLNQIVIWGRIFISGFLFIGIVITIAIIYLLYMFSKYHILNNVLSLLLG